MAKIGVFICHCGVNIAGTVDVEKVVKEVARYPGVVHASHYQYMCSDPGQSMIKEAVQEKGLDGVVVAACSPTLHEVTFRRAVEAVGLNPYRCEIANIREQCSWVHSDWEQATQKAQDLIAAAVAKTSLLEPLEEEEIDVIPRALVIGGGIAGMQAALDIANAGYEVVLVERFSSIGGHMAQLSETFPTLDCSSCILTPRMVEVSQHVRIRLMTYCELEELSGYVGNFKACIRRKAAYVDWGKCTGCGLCSEKCPSRVPSEFDEFLGERKAIYIPFPQAVPNKPVIDRENCIYFQRGKCKVCEKVCPLQAIDFEQEDEVIEEEFGVVVVATGYDLYPMEQVKEYGFGRYKDVINGLQFERLLSASGPTGGGIHRPSDGKIPKEVVFIQCVASRDPELGVPYCSKICCMYTVKHAMLYKHKVPDGQPYVFYIDIRSAGKGYEEFVQRAQEEDRVLYVRGKVSKVFEEDGKVVVWGVDTLTGQQIEIAADLVVLATAVVPRKDAKDLARKLKIPTDQFGFLSEVHPKLRPVESLTAGIFLAGCAQAPKDIPEAVAQASGAASKALTLLSTGKVKLEAISAIVDEAICGGCGVCVSVCPFEAITLHTENSQRIATVIAAQCKGCGSCGAACPSGAISIRHFKDHQILAQINALAEGLTAT